MTTIAYRDRVLAADTLATCNDMREGYMTKIENVKGVLVAAAGSAALCLRFRAWVREGMEGDCPILSNDDGNGFVVTPDGRVVVWGKNGPWTMRHEFFALGSGEQVAMGAMQVGATAEAAVRAAMALDTGTGGEITVLRH